MALTFSMSDLNALLAKPADRTPARTVHTACEPSALPVHVDGNLALAPTPEALPVPVPQIKSMATRIVAAEKYGAAKSRMELLSREQQAIVRDQLAVAKAVWELWAKGGRTFSEAYAAVTARIALGEFPALAAHGKYTETSVRRWQKACGAKTKTSRPTWQHDKLAFNYREGGIKQSDTTALPEVFSSIFTGLYLTRTQRSVPCAYLMTRGIIIDEDLLPRDQIPTEAQARYYAQNKIPKRLIERHRTPKFERAKIGGYMLRKWKNTGGATFIMDHHRLDLWCKTRTPDGDWTLVRPWLTAVRDAATGFVLSVLVYDDAAPNHLLVLEALYNAIMAAAGVLPKIILIDNGKDFLKRGVFTDLTIDITEEEDEACDGILDMLSDVAVGEHGVYETYSVARALGVEIKRAQPYKGRQKPVERDFRNVAHHFAKIFPQHVYTGCSPATRPENSPEKSKRYRRDPSHYPTAIQIQDELEKFLVWLHDKPSNGRILLGKTPAEAWAARDLSTAVPMDMRRLQLAMMAPQPRLYIVREGPSGADIWYRSWPYAGKSDADVLAMRSHFRDGKIMVKTSFSSPMFDFGKKRLPVQLFAFSTDGRFIAELKAVSEVDAFEATIGDDHDEFVAACRRIAIVARSDKEQREIFTSGLTERQLITEAGTPRALIAAPRTDGPGLGRARVQPAAIPAPPPEPEPDPLPEVDPALLLRFQDFVTTGRDDDPTDEEETDIDLKNFYVSDDPTN